MSEIVVRIPWNKKIARRLIIGVSILVPIFYIVLTHGVTKYRIGFTEDENAATASESGWIVTLREELPFEGTYGPRYKICMDDFTGDRVYVWSSSSGFDVGKIYFNKNAQFMGEWYHGDAGDIPEDFIGNNLHFCERVPAWFFSMKVDKRQVQN